MRHLSYANVMATIAVFVALGGSSYAALKVTGRDVVDGSLTGRDIRNGSLTGADLKDGSVTGKDIKNGSLTGTDLKDGSVTGDDIKDGSVTASDLAPDVVREGPQGPAGPQGPPGPQGPKGDPGTVDTSAFYDKAQSDARFLAVDGKAADAALLDGTPKSGFVQTSDGYARLPGKTPAAADCTSTAHHGRLASSQDGAWLCTGDGWQAIADPHVKLQTVATGTGLGIHVTVSGYPPNTAVSYAYAIPGFSYSGPLGTTDANGILDLTHQVSSCGYGGATVDWRIAVGGRTVYVVRRALPSC